MGVKVKYYRGDWWVFIHHRGRRRSKKIGDRETALQTATKIRRRLADGDFQLAPTEKDDTLDTYARAWLKAGGREPEGVYSSLLHREVRTARAAGVGHASPPPSSDKTSAI